MKTILFSVLFIFSCLFSEAQSKASLFRKFETILNKAEGKTITYVQSSDPKNSPRYVVTKQVFSESQVVISFTDGKTIYTEEHSNINWADAIGLAFIQKDPNDSTINKLTISFDIEHRGRMLQDGKVYQEQKATLIEVYFLASDRAKIEELRTAIEKLQAAEQD